MPLRGPASHGSSSSGPQVKKDNDLPVSYQEACGFGWTIFGLTKQVVYPGKSWLCFIRLRAMGSHTISSAIDLSVLMRYSFTAGNINFVYGHA